MSKQKLGVINYYHVSDCYLGDIFTFKPKVSSCSIIEEEGNIPRVSVSLSIVNCLLSKISNRKATVNDLLKYGYEGKHYYSNPSCYVTNKVPYLPPNAIDFRFNKEHWFIDDIEMQFLGYIDLAKVLDGKLALTTNSTTLKMDDYSKHPMLETKLKDLILDIKGVLCQ